MSYCRWGYSDVYMFRSVTGGITCCACFLNKKNEGALFPPDTHLKTYDEAIAHLEKHRDAGHSVPASAFEEIRRDQEDGISLDPSVCSKCSKPFDGPALVNLNDGTALCHNCQNLED